MIARQTEFRDTEAQAICSMLATLSDDDYTVEICHIGSQLGADGMSFYPFSVIVKDKASGDVVATAQHYYLVDALTECYGSTPEREVSK